MTVLRYGEYEVWRRRIEWFCSTLTVKECREHGRTASESVIESSDVTVEVLLWVGGTAIAGRHNEYRGGFLFPLFRRMFVVVLKGAGKMKRVRHSGN